MDTGVTGGFVRHRDRMVQESRAHEAEDKKRRELIEKAKHEYAEALAIWKQHGAQGILGISQPNKVAVLERKIARIQPVN